MRKISDYIERETAMHAVWGCARATGIHDAPFEYASGIIKDLPPADVAPVRHGHWRLVSRLDEVEWLYGAVIECSQCKHEEVAHYNYCPNCGAKMDEGE